MSWPRGSGEDEVCVVRRLRHTGSDWSFVVPSMNDRSGVGFSDATRDICVTRIFAWRRRSAQAGNRGVLLGGAFVAMGIWVVCLSQIRPDRPDEGAPSGRARGAILRHMADTGGILAA